jgi:hypothetical protein
LVGKVDASAAYDIYAVRPEVCRACEPEDDACQIARQKFGLPPVHSVSVGEVGTEVIERQYRCLGTTIEREMNSSGRDTRAFHQTPRLKRN